MVGFIRRYLADPGIAELTSIEGVVVIDKEPAGAITGVGSGTAMLVGEFEDGPFVPTEVSSGPDLNLNFGGFGFTYDGVPSQNPCARSRKADGALNPEYWNGNGFIALVNKKFSRLIVVRVDTSVGSVDFSRLAFVTGGNDFNFALNSGQVLGLNLGGADLDTTFTGVAATQTSGAGTYPSTFVGGETLTFTIDEGTPQQIGPVTVSFLSTDSTQSQVMARLNAAAGYTAFTQGATTTTVFTGRHQGTAGNVRINAVSGVLVTTATGFSAGAATAGAGNVANIKQVTLAEINTLVAAASTNTIRVTRDSNNNLRATNVSSAAAQTIEVAASTTATALGFVVGDTNSNEVGEDGQIPAGTRVRASGNEWVTMQTIAVTADNRGPYAVKIRPADDDGTMVGTGAGTVNTVPSSPSIGEFAVINTLPIAAALTEPALDAAYLTAIDTTLNGNAISREANLFTSARSSNAVRTRMRSNALQASEEGLLGRCACIRPPLGTTRAMAKSTVSQPGVGTTRDQRVFYAYPGVNTFVPQIAARGLAGGDGFTADGIIDTGFDTWAMSIMSQLPPEENPGQETGFVTEILGLERNNQDVQDLRVNDYKAFKAQGIMAPKMDNGVAVIQSAVTSVDPLVHPGLKNIARRRMADYLQDTGARRLSKDVKKGNTRERRATVYSDLDSWLTELAANPGQRITSYLLDAKSGNTPETIALGVYRIIGKVRIRSSMDVIVFETEIGENVTTFSEVA